eukprot:gb/GECG01008922.1/.p1 GENE.gb/GECG01008922.1/~~gb/GECG01008922.1/.p1  ORF type:complete len:130 (+),score=29.89 gb/GECG01008922.1/:1-390(+)
MENKPSISFDSEGKVRVLEPEKFKQTEELQTQCREFVSKISEFSEGVSTVLEVLNAQAEQIERAKLKAVGARNMVESEQDNRKRRRKELQAQIEEKRQEYERLQAEYDSLVRVEQEQREMIEQLENNDV